MVKLTKKEEVLLVNRGIKAEMGQIRSGKLKTVSHEEYLLAKKMGKIHAGIKSGKVKVRKISELKKKSPELDAASKAVKKMGVSNIVREIRETREKR